MLNGIFDQITEMTGLSLALSFGASLLCGIIIAAVHRLGTRRYSRNLIITIVLLPIVVQSLIMMVNGSIGTGIAVAGVFSLVRFRSVPGNARDICAIFMAMASGIAVGAGYLFYAVVFTVTVSVIMLAAEKLLPENREKDMRRLKITVPEDMEFNGAFDDIFEKYLSCSELDSVKTTHMGTMYELVYLIQLKDETKEKEMIDAIRCRNGNLPICSSHQNDGIETL